MKNGLRIEWLRHFDRPNALWAYDEASQYSDKARGDLAFVPPRQ